MVNKSGMTKARKFSNALNEMFVERCNHEFQNKFGREITTNYNLIHMTYVSAPVKGKFTKEQKAWLSGWSDGFADAMNQVCGMS